MGKHFRTTQKVKREKPNYNYTIRISSSAGFMGGYDVYVQGYASDPNSEVEDNENYLTEWFWRRPSREKLFELVDRLHGSVRDSMAERDWDKIKDDKVREAMEEARKRLEEEHRSRLEAELMRIKRELEEKTDAVEDRIDLD